MVFEKLRDDDGVAVGQNLGEIWFRGQDSAQNTEDYAYIIGEIDVSTGGQESGELQFGVAGHDGSTRTAMILTGGSQASEVDAVIGLGANSVVTIPGNIDLAGDIDVDGTLETDALTIGGVTVAAAGTSSITTLGTIATGEWQGTAIDSEYIADDAITFAKAVGVTPNVYGTTIKVLPSDFMANEEGGVTKTLQFVDDSASGLKAGNANTELLAFVAIPEGMKATLVDVYDNSHNLAVAVFEVDINSAGITSKGTGNANTQIDITDVNATATNFLMIQVTTTALSHRIFGALVTIAAQ